MLKELWCAGATRVYWLWSGALLLVYALTARLSLVVAPTLASPPLKALAALSPIAPVMLFVMLEYRRIRATDELRQRMELEAGMYTIAIALPVLLALVLLDNAGIVDAPLLVATPILLVLYAFAQMWAHQRYR